MGRPRTDIRPRVLHAARARFLVDGVDGASLRTIAKDAKTSVGMIFYYFPTKDDLFMAVIEDVYAKLLVDIEAILGARAALRTRLERAFTRLGDASPEELDVVRLVIREALVASPRFDLIFARFRRGHIGMMMTALQDGMDHGEVDSNVPLPLMLVATFGVGGIPQVLRRVAATGLPLPSSEVLARASADLLFRGIAPKKKR